MVNELSANELFKSRLQIFRNDREVVFFVYRRYAKLKK